MSNSLKDGASRVVSLATDTAESARAAANDAIGTARTTVSGAYTNARESVASAGKRAAGGIDDAPLAIAVGGLALGALAGVLIPASRRETELLRPAGEKLNDAARGAADAAKAAGIAKLSELGIDRVNARAQLDKLVDAVTQGATSAGSAAASSIRGKQ